MLVRWNIVPFYELVVSPLSFRPSFEVRVMGFCSSAVCIGLTSSSSWSRSRGASASSALARFGWHACVRVALARSLLEWFRLVRRLRWHASAGSSPARAGSDLMKTMIIHSPRRGAVPQLPPEAVWEAAVGAT
jgi:hypothetical protein